MHFNAEDYIVSGHDSSASQNHFQVVQGYNNGGMATGEGEQYQGVEFIGMTAGGQCQCGFSSSIGRQVSTLQCNQPCKKQPNMKCGGQAGSDITSIFGIGRFEIGGLKPEREYHFQMHIYAGYSFSYHDILTVQTTTKTPPGPPRRLSFLTRTGGSIKLAW